MPAPLSIAICTHNRPDYLLALVEALLPQTRPHDVPILVIDSASTPPASTVLNRLAQSAPTVISVRLDQPGVSRARNMAFQIATTPWIGFIDDDEIPAPDWVDQALALIRRLPDSCAACGGNVLPRWPAGADPQLSRRWRDFLSIIEQVGEFDQSARPTFGGGHSLIRIAALAQVSGFDERLGRDGTSLLSGEEALLIDGLIKAGWQVWHSDRIRVDHIIEPERLQRSWVLDRAFWEGVSTMRRMSIAAPAAAREKARSARNKSWLLRPLAALLPSQLGWDIRLAFARGMLAEAEGRPSASTAGRRKPAPPDAVRS
jgi:glycosyltransferase involved in cell wall biosynthesis